MTHAELTALLLEAQKEHHKHEQAEDAPEDWAAWYARFILDKVHASAPAPVRGTGARPYDGVSRIVGRAIERIDRRERLQGDRGNVLDLDASMFVPVIPVPVPGSLLSDASDFRTFHGDSLAWGPERKK